MTRTYDSHLAGPLDHGIKPCRRGDLPVGVMATGPALKCAEYPMVWLAVTFMAAMLPLGRLVSPAPWRRMAQASAASMASAARATRGTRDLSCVPRSRAARPSQA